MNHKVQSVQTLYEDAVALFNRGVMGSEDTSADTIINNLMQGINVLQGCWEGKDAGVQIQNVVGVHNAMISIRNVLGELAVDSSKIAANYRDIQNSNGAGLETLSPLAIETKTIMPDYSDTRDTVGINPEANNGKARIDAANNSMDGFIANVKMFYDKIMQNWTMGTGREKAVEAFDEFIAKSNQYKQTLSDVSASITTALNNYSF